jgi:hypothetical protein
MRSNCKPSQAGSTTTITSPRPVKTPNYYIYVVTTRPIQRSKKHHEVEKPSRQDRKILLLVDEMTNG